MSARYRAVDDAVAASPEMTYAVTRGRAGLSPGGGMALNESIVVLFTDLVGSTALANRLDPETADELRQHHFSVLRQALSAHDGTEVKNLGDGLMVVFTSASAALSCATAMQQGVEADNRRQDPSVQVGIRVGVSAGEALHEEDDYFGDPVIEAARLCAQAEGGQILVAEWVKALAGRRVSFSFEARGALSLKGIPEAVETLSLGWEPVADEPEAADSEAPSIPLPAPVALGPDIGALVGRDEHNDVLTQAFKRVAAGEGREVVLICGEPGVGKSTVVASLARRAHELDAVVLVGHYDEEVTLSYQGFSEALSHYAAHVSDDVLASLVDADGAELAVMVPSLRRRLHADGADRSADPDTSRYLLFSATVSFLAHAQMAAPVVVVLEDLQWADTQSLQLLRHLVSASDPLRLLIVATYRDEISPRLTR